MNHRKSHYMRVRAARAFLIAAMAAGFWPAATSPGHAAVYTWTDGWYSLSQVNPGLPFHYDVNDVLHIGPKTNDNYNPYNAEYGLKFFNGGTIRNQGSIEITESAFDLYFTATTIIENEGVIDIGSDIHFKYGGGNGNNTIYNYAGGTIRKSAGSGEFGLVFAGSSYDTARFTNAGTLDCQSGSMRYAWGYQTFADGTRFTGAGTHYVDSYGDYTVSTHFFGNFNVDAGATVVLDAADSRTTFVGEGASFTGEVKFRSGILANEWTVNEGSTLRMVDGGTKRIQNTQFQNDGLFILAAGNLGLSTAQFVNNGTMDIAGDWTVDRFGLGSWPTLTNNGTIVKSAGLGTASLGVSIDFNFINNGLIDVQSGTLHTGSGSFTQNAGTIRTAEGTVFDTGDDGFTNYGTIDGSGTVRLRNGTRRLTNAGEIKPGNSPGTLTIDGGFTQTVDGHLNIEIGGVSAGEFDVLNITGSANLGGTLDLWRLAGYSPQVGDTFEFLTASSISGGFNVVYHGFEGAEFGDLVYGSNSIQVGVVKAVPEPATVVGFATALLALVARKRRR
jgi:hypothetical protein